MERLAWLLAPSGENVSFAVRTCLSVAIALYLAFRLRLDDAYWAFINVAILIQPLPGYLVVRGFARLVGTAVAGTVSIVLIALFAQSYTLVSVAMVLWVGSMVFCASLFRNNLSYGFVLAGYVTMIVAVRAMSDPSTVFSVAVARTAETGLATVVAATVSVLLAPGMTARRYVSARVESLRAIGDQLSRLIQNTDPVATDPHGDWHALVEKSLTLEQTRRYARFDAPGFSRYDHLARRLNYELLSLVSSMMSLQTYLRRVPETIDWRPLHELREAADQLAENPNDTRTIKQSFGHAYSRILSRARRTPDADSSRSIADWVMISRALDLANRLGAAITKHDVLIHERAVQTSARARSEFDTPADLRGSIRTTVRAMAAISGGALIWATHAEPALSGMMVLLAVLTTLFALGDNPTAGARGFGIAALVAAVVAFVVNFWFLPLANSYVTLMIVIMPVVFVGALAMATPAYALIGRVGLVIFALLVHPANASRQTFVGYAETFMGVGLAVLLALAAFSLILPVSPRQLLRERVAHIFYELSRGLSGRREHFETRVFDLLLRLPVSADQGEVHVDARRAAFAAANMGLEARSLDLLAERVGFSKPLHEAIEARFAGLQRLFAKGYPTIAAVTDEQAKIDQLARDLLTEAVTLSGQRRRRYAIRAAVAGQLLASALADYVRTRESAQNASDTIAGAAHAT